MSSPEPSDTPKAVETPVAQETPGDTASAELSPEQLEGVSGGTDAVKHITEIVTQISNTRAEIAAGMVKNIR